MQISCLFLCVIKAINLCPDDFSVQRIMISIIIFHIFHFVIEWISRNTDWNKQKGRKIPVVIIFKHVLGFFFQPFDIDDDYCGKYDFNTPINGPESVKASRAIGINSSASSLIVTTTHAGYTVAFIGTRTGHIKKVRHTTFLTFPMQHSGIGKMFTRPVL